MKTSLSVLLLSVACAVGAPIVPNTSTWGLTFDQPTNMPVLLSYVPGTNQAYQVYGTPTLNTPLANWTLLTTWTSWSLVTNGTSISLSNNIQVSFGQWFFYVNPTNMFGAAPLLSGFGAVGNTGPPWSTVNNSSLSRQGP